jgi:O-antigen/teichoic acid export membrane protein
VGILSTGVVLYAIANVAACGISLARQTKYLGAYTLIATLLNVALNFLLIPVWGMLGAATATAAGYGLLAILSYRTAQRIYHTPYELRRSLLTLLVACPLMGIGALPIAPGGLALTVKLTALGAFALTIWRLRLIGEDELDALRSLTHQLRSRFLASRAAS